MLLNWSEVTENLLPELSAQDRAVIELTSYGSTRAFGKRPALVLVDFQYAYVGEDVAITEQLDKHPTAGGAAAWQALRNALPLLHKARELDIPVVLSRIAHTPDDAKSDTFSTKRGASADFIDGSRGASLVDELEARESDFLLKKVAASCFHQTNLMDHLSKLGVDTVIVGGLSTSGCVRATVVDAAGYGLSVMVLRDASADRIELSHRVALFDIWMKYGEVAEVSDALDYITGLG